MTDIRVPARATHFQTCYGTPTFWMTQATDWSREHCKWYYNWYYWERDEWILDRSASSRLFRPIAEFNPEEFA